MKTALLVIGLVFLVPTFSSAATFNVDDGVIARWTNHLYFPGKVLSISDTEIQVLFDDGDKITHSTGDISAVIHDQAPPWTPMQGTLVLGTKGGSIYKIGYIWSERYSQLQQEVVVKFDDDTGDSCHTYQLRVLPLRSSADEEGARVFARWTEDKYYRGFVTKGYPPTEPFHVRFDDGDTLPLPQGNNDVMLADKLSCWNEVKPKDSVIAYRSGDHFAKGSVFAKIDFGETSCYQYDVYDVRFEDGHLKRDLDFDQIRLLP